MPLSPSIYQSASHASSERLLGIASLNAPSKSSSKNVVTSLPFDFVRNGLRNSLYRSRLFSMQVPRRYSRYSSGKPFGPTWVVNIKLQTQQMDLHQYLRSEFYSLHTPFVEPRVPPFGASSLASKLIYKLLQLLQPSATTH